MPFGAFLALAAGAIAPGLGRGHRHVHQRSAILHGLHFGVAAEIADENDFVDAARHGGLLGFPDATGRGTYLTVGNLAPPACGQPPILGCSVSQAHDGPLQIHWFARGVLHMVRAMKDSFHVSQVSRGQANAMLGGAALMMTLAMGIRQNLGLFQAPAAHELGIAISDFALAISVQQVAWGVSQPFAGVLADKYGTRWVSLVGSLIYIVGLILTATATSTLPIVIGAGVMIGVALACTTSGITANIAARVVAPTRRTLAFGIVSAAGSVGTMVTAPIAAYVLNHDSWRAGLWVFVIIAIAMLPAAFVGSSADRLPNGRTTDRNLTLGNALGEAGRHTGYVVMSIAFFVC